MRVRQLRLKARSFVRQIPWRLWPNAPTTWSQVPARIKPAVIQISRLTIATVAAFAVTNAFNQGSGSLTAALTALLVVQASTVGTLQTGLVRVGAVLTGVLVAVGIASWLGLSWWSLGLVVFASLLIARALRLGDQLLEAPISGMLILAVSAPGLAAETRILNTLIGSVIGIAFSFLIPMAIPNAPAVEAVRRVARSQASLLDEIALTIVGRPPLDEEVEAWSDWAEHLEGELDEAQRAIKVAGNVRQLNPRALTTAKVHPGLDVALTRLSRCLVAERALLVVIAEESPSGDIAPSGESGGDIRRAFAVVLDDLANGLRAFGDLIVAQYRERDVQRVDEALGRTLDIVRETRAVLTELILLDVDPRRDTDVWMLQGSVLTAVDQVVAQLDLEDNVRTRDAWVDRVGLPRLPDVWHLPHGRSGHRDRDGRVAPEKQ